MSTFDTNKRMVIRDRFGDILDYSKLKVKSVRAVKEYINQRNLGPIKVTFEPIEKNRSE